MDKSISKLIELAKGAKVSTEQRAQQRRSFVYGNTAFENDSITREFFDKNSRDLEASAPASSLRA